MVGTKWHFRQIQGILLKIQELGICVVHCDNSNDFPKSIEWLWKHDRSKIINLPPRKFGMPILPSHIVLTAFDGIGSKRANQLLGKFGSLAAVLECLANNNCPLPDGIGPKIRQVVQEVLGLSIDEKLVIERVKDE